MKIAFTMTFGNPISETIVYFTKESSKLKPSISHSLPIFGYMNDIELGFSADEWLINIVDVDRYRTKGHAMRVYELPDKIEPKLWQREIIARKNQKIYPHFELLWFVYRWIRRKINKDWNGKNWFSYSSFCSELTIESLRLAGYGEYFKGIDANVTDAIELENIVARLPCSKIVEVYNNE